MKIKFTFQMETKPNPKAWWKSKTIWAGIASLTTGVLNALGYPLPPELLSFLIGVGLITSRVSDRPIGK